MTSTKVLWFVVSALLGVHMIAQAPDHSALFRSCRSGAWSDAKTWEGGLVPTGGARVQVRRGHTVTYDLDSARAIRFIHVAGVLTFAPDRNTRLDVGLLKIEPSEIASEDGFDCDAHPATADPALPAPALLVGTQERPIGAAWKATIRLVWSEGLDRETCPALVCCGGRMDFHGAPMNRAWVKLGQTARKGDAEVLLGEGVTGWQVGDHVIVTATQTHNNGRERGTLLPGATGRQAFTEERTITAIRDRSLTLDRPLAQTHEVRGECRGEVANLSRNVVIESADPAGVRGHTMYHRGSSGSISYAEFRHLGKEGILGKYSLHFHLVGTSMRGSSVVGASIWDSGNRWITIHGTNYLVVRDCVGYRSVGHGFYLEDGSETCNVFDRNLAVQAFAGKALPGQFLPFDHNDGAGFWWANSLNSFTRNVAVECDRYGYRYEATPDSTDRLVRPVRRPAGTVEEVDIRTLPFVRFDGNEAHTQLYGMNMGEGAGGIGPDESHPFVIKDMKVWDCLWSFRPGAPSIVIDGIDISRSQYGIFIPRYDPRIQPHGRMTARGVNLPGVMTASPTAIPGEQAALPVGLDAQPPYTIITSVTRTADGRVKVRGTTADNGEVKRVSVNGREARPLAANFLEWEVELDAQTKGRVTAVAADAAGNTEAQPHVAVVP
jgi:G8 domain